MKSLSLNLRIAAGAIAVAAFLFATSAHAQSTMLTAQLDFGARGANVTSLQQFLAADVTVYPEGLVTGYFGPLTRAAVQRYQCKRGIVCNGSAATTGYGRVGPSTLAAINASIGGGVVTGDVSAPVIFSTSAATASASATIHFNTNEMATGKVFYSSAPIAFSEAAGIGFAPVVTGVSAMTDASFRVSHDVMLSGLAPSTTYFYVVQATDASGNVSLTWPATFRTAP